MSAPPSPRAGHRRGDDPSTAAGTGPHVHVDQVNFDDQGSNVGVDPATDHVITEPHRVRVGGGPNVRTGQTSTDVHGWRAGADPNIGTGQSRNATQAVLAVAEHSPPSTNGSPTPRAGASTGASTPPAPAKLASTSNGETSVPAGNGQTDPAISGALPSDRPLDLFDPLLALAADVLDDLERVRIANENRLRQLTRDETDADGEERGFGLTLDHPDVARLAALVDGLIAAEHQAELNLAARLRKHPLGPWVKAQRGIGAKQGARLLATIGDPFWNDLHGRPRTVSELWSYCGYRPGQKRARGIKANWSTAAKMRAYVVSESCLQQLVKPCHTVKGDKGEYLHAEHLDGCACGGYRLVYDQGRAKYADTVHPEDCARCGPAGKPAQVGSPRSAKHQHMMAIRLVSKAVLRDLWKEAKRLHDAADPTSTLNDHGCRDDQGPLVVEGPVPPAPATSSPTPTPGAPVPAVGGSYPVGLGQGVGDAHLAPAEVDGPNLPGGQGELVDQRQRAAGGSTEERARSSPLIA